MLTKGLRWGLSKGHQNRFFLLFFFFFFLFCFSQTKYIYQIEKGQKNINVYTTLVALRDVVSNQHTSSCRMDFLSF